MYNLLILDDEEYIVVGYTKGVSWESAGVGGVFGVTGVREAEKIALSTTIDILLCDIEMPGKSGFDFAEWLYTLYPAVKVIYLTGHADFFYAQRALRLQCYDYLLKPVEMEYLQKIVGTLTAAMDKTRKLTGRLTDDGYYDEDWKREAPYLAERIWQDLLFGDRGAGTEEWDSFFARFDIPLKGDSEVCPVVISISQPNASQGAYGGMFAVSKLAADILTSGNGTIVYESVYRIAAVCWGDSVDGDMEIAHRCAELSDTCLQINTDIACYVGKVCKVGELETECRRLAALSSEDITRENSVILENVDLIHADIHCLPLNKWENLLVGGMYAQLKSGIAQYLSRWETGADLSLLVFTLTGIAFKAVCEAGNVSPELYRGAVRTAADVKTAEEAYSWACEIVDAVEASVSRRNQSTIIHRAKEYIGQNLSAEFSRDLLASQVFVHPNYLSKLFKKETGVTISEYIQQCRITRAKELLRETNHKISAICDDVGMFNRCYFSKFFKAVTGMTPQEYRQKYQNLDQKWKVE